MTNSETKPPKASGVGFFVGDTPYVCWEWNMLEKNLEFIRGIEHGYFEYVATAHRDNLEGEQRHLAALSIRTAYFHGIETLFSLLCAATFAPHCVPGWLQRCGTAELREVVGQINKGTCIVSNPLRIESVSWHSIAERVMPLGNLPNEERLAFIEEFAGLWTRLAIDWLQASNIGEYNGIKHGLRVKPGGFSIAFAPAKEDGSKPSPDEMTLLGASPFGSSYFHAEAVLNAAKKSRTHFRLKGHYTNWFPDSLCRALGLISGSICNVQTFLRYYNGDRAQDLPAFQPKSKSEFRAPWENVPGVSHATLDMNVVAEENIIRFDEEEVARRLRERLEKREPPPQGS
jgi:hypothetical protein